MREVWRITGGSEGGGLTVVISTDETSYSTLSALACDTKGFLSDVFKTIQLPRDTGSPCMLALDLDLRCGNYHLGPLGDVTEVKFIFTGRCLRLHASLNCLSPYGLGTCAFWTLCNNRFNLDA